MSSNPANTSNVSNAWRYQREHQASTAVTEFEKILNQDAQNIDAFVVDEHVLPQAREQLRRVEQRAVAFEFKPAAFFNLVRAIRSVHCTRSRTHTNRARRERETQSGQRKRHGQMRSLHPGCRRIEWCRRPTWTAWPSCGNAQHSGRVCISGGAYSDSPDSCTDAGSWAVRRYPG